MYKITLNNISFSYSSQKVLENISIVADPGDFICFLGPSGCGKSTLLRLLAGLEKTGSGEILINEKPVRGPGLDRGVVFQDYSLFPWMTARENIVIALEQAFPEKSRYELGWIAAEYLDLVGLQEAYDKLPKELSGGMRQRAAIALVFAINSPVLLMDEPFGALDAITRAHLQDLLLNLWDQNGAAGKTILFVTHDVDEALLLANKIVIMTLNPGTVKRIIPVSLPRPRNRQDLYTDTACQALRAEVMGLLNETIVHELDTGQIAGSHGELI